MFRIEEKKWSGWGLFSLGTPPSTLLLVSLNFENNSISSGPSGKKKKSGPEMNSLSFQQQQKQHRIISFTCIVEVEIRIAIHELGHIFNTGGIE